jgi:hypothetical protein
VENVGGESHKAGHGQRRAGVGNVFLGDAIARDYQNCGIDSFGLGTCQITVNSLDAVMLEDYAAVLDG